MEDRGCRAHLDADLRPRADRLDRRDRRRAEQPAHRLRGQRRGFAAPRPRHRRRHLQIGRRRRDAGPTSDCATGSRSPRWRSIRPTPNRLFVAVLGHPYGPNDERGIYRSLDGGATFQRVLFKNENVGAFDVVIDPHDPKIVYATLWAARQAPWEIGASFEMPGSGIFKSSDGGTTWTQLTAGLPARIGRAEVAVAPSDSQIVYAYADVEAKGQDAGALYRSSDAGAHFTQVNDAAEIAQRGDDLVSLAVDPRDPQTVYLTNTSTYRSTDGGKTLVAIKGAPGGDDYHTVWINPNDPRIIALAADQGATISVDGGRTWSSWYNQPTAQMYHVNADNRFPYWVCGGQQESGSACVISRGDWGETTERDWHPVGAQEYGYVVPDPLHPGLFYGGKVEKFDERTGQAQEVSPIALPSKKYRVVRTEPIAFDPLRQAPALLRLQRRLRDRGRRTQLAGDQPRSHSCASGRAAGNRSLRTRRSCERRAPRRRLCARALARARRHDLGRNRRRLDLDHARWREPLEGRHAAGSDALEQDLPNRRLAFRRPDRIRGGQPLSAQRSASRTSTSRATAAPRGALRRPAYRRQRSTQCARIRSNRASSTPRRKRRLRLIRRRGALAIAAAGASAHIGARSDRARNRRGDRDPRARILDSRRRRAAARPRAQRRARREGRAPLRSRARLPRSAQHQQRYAAAAGGADRRESARRSDPRLRARVARAPCRDLDRR